MNLVKSVMREIENKSKEFYEFVLPPVDIHATEDSLKVVIDIPGFAKKDIDLTLYGSILSIKARKADEAGDGDLLCNQRPGIIDKKIRLPAYIKRGEEEISSAKLEDGVLTLIIPLTKRGKSIPLD